MKKKIHSLNKVIKSQNFEIETLLNQITQLHIEIVQLQQQQYHLEKSIATLYDASCQDIASIRIKHQYTQELKRHLEEVHKQLQTKNTIMETKRNEIATIKNRQKAIEKLVNKYKDQIKKKEEKNETAVFDAFSHRKSSR